MRNAHNKSLQLSPMAGPGSSILHCCGSCGSDAAAQLNSMLGVSKVDHMSQKRSVLVVDDEPIIREFFTRMLARMGFDSFQAEDNDQAYAILAQHRIDLVTTDLVRPKASGIDFIKQVRENPKTGRVPIIMITGSASKDVELEAWRSGVSAFFPKPLGFEEFITSVGRLLSKSVDADLEFLRLGIEGRDLDYKECIDLEKSSARAEFARDVIAFANSGGGRIVVGVAETENRFQWIGLNTEELAQYETTRLNDSIRKYVGATATVSSKVIEDQGKLFMIVAVSPATDTIALALQANQQAGLFTGRIYVRSQDGRSAELSDPMELQRMVDRLVENRVRKLLGGRRSNPSKSGDA